MLLAERTRTLEGDPKLFAAAIPELSAPGPLGPELSGPLRRGLFRALATAAETLGEQRIRGHLLGWYWLQAGDRAQARRALQSALEQGVGPAEARVLLGNLAHDDGDSGTARESYRRAFCEAPLEVDPTLISDAAVASLVDEAASLELSPAAAWVPLVGWAANLFWLPPEPQGQEPCRTFHQALLASRKGDVAARRRMKELAPLFFEQLRDDGKLA